MNKLNFKNALKRIGAYMIDIFIIISMASLVTNLKPFKEKYDKYQEKYNEYQKIQEYNNISAVDLEKSYLDEKITLEEYNKLIENKKYKVLIEPFYDDLVIDKNEYKEILKKINSEEEKTSSDFNYKLQKLGIFNSIITLTITLLYFGVLQYLLKGQTIGKKILNIKVVSANSKKLNVFNYLLRSLIINNVLLNAINVIVLNYFTRSIFMKVTNVISILVSIVEALTIYLVISREDNRGIHDLICNTKVVSVKEEIVK